MKKTLLYLICFFAFLLTAKAQTIYGTTWQGGTDGGGTISKFTVPGNKLTVAKSLDIIQLLIEYLMVFSFSRGLRKSSHK